MKYFWRYVENEPQKFFSAVRCFFFWFILCFLYTHFIILHDRQFRSFYLVELVRALPFAYAALLEETFFRAMPFYLIYVFTKKREKYFKPLIFSALILFSFMFFGFTHHWRVINILFEGIWGLTIGTIYLKFGGMKGKLIKPLLVCTLFHCLQNILMLSLSYSIKISG